jgi:hypothetical protein
MTTTALDLLDRFESLPLGDRREVAAEILRRSTASGDLLTEACDELASDLFQSYDAEEASGGSR